jgi:hypothetical protein
MIPPAPHKEADMAKTNAERQAEWRNRRRAELASQHAAELVL